MCEREELYLQWRELMFDVASLGQIVQHTLDTLSPVQREEWLLRADRTESVFSAIMRDTRKVLGTPEAPPVVHRLDELQKLVAMMNTVTGSSWLVSYNPKHAPGEGDSQSYILWETLPQGTAIRVFEGAFPLVLHEFYRITETLKAIEPHQQQEALPCVTHATTTRTSRTSTRPGAGAPSGPRSPCSSSAPRTPSPR